MVAVAVPRTRSGVRHPLAVLNPEKQATILRLAAEDHTYRQIAAAVGVSPSTVRRFLLGLTYGQREK